MTDFAKVLLAVCPHGKPAIRAGFAASMQKCIDYADLTTTQRLAIFIGEWAEESDGFNAVVEYASGKAYNPPGKVARNLGNTQPGDGPRFKGRGLPMLTGRSNYRTTGGNIGVDLENNPEKAAEFPYAALTAADFWKTSSLNKLADANDIDGVTHRINGGFNGLAVRKAYIAKAKAALADLKGALLAGAAEQTKAAKTKTALAAAPVTASLATVAPQTQASGLPVAAIVIVGLLALAGAAWLAVWINRHKQAAAALTAAAKEI